MKQDDTNLAILDLLSQFKHRFDKIDDRFDQIDQRFDQIDQRFEQVDQRFEQMEQRFEQVGQRFEQVDQHFEQVGQRFEQMDQRLQIIEDNVVENQRLITKNGHRLDLLGSQLAELDDDAPTGEEFALLETRVNKLEATVAA